MLILKFIILGIILFLSSYIGIILSNKYKNRLIELKEIKKALNIFETKIKYTYAPVPEIFKDISDNLTNNVGEIFLNASNKMENDTAQNSWRQAVEEAKTNMNKDDLEVIKDLGKLLGKTDIEGQISQIELTDKFIDKNIENAEKEYLKNNKLYKTLRDCFRSCLSYCSYIKIKQRRLIWILIYFLK